jgi:hypothetical protein
MRNPPGARFPSLREFLTGRERAQHGYREYLEILNDLTKGIGKVILPHLFHEGIPLGTMRANKGRR